MEARVENANMEVTWDAHTRVVHVRYLPGAKLGRADGDLLAGALEAWAGNEQPYGIIANAAHLVGIDGDYRARMSALTKKHRNLYIALIDVGPVVQIIVSMFRLATQVHIQTFSDEAAARAWLREKGIPT